MHMHMTFIYFSLLFAFLCIRQKIKNKFQVEVAAQLNTNNDSSNKEMQQQSKFQTTHAHCCKYILMYVTNGKSV